MGHEEDMSRSILLGLSTAMKMKKRMQDDGLRRARAKCPKCGGRINALLAGRKDHIHMSCETPDCLWVIQ